MITHDITIRRGDTLKPIVFKETHETINFAGSTARAHIRKLPSSPTVLGDFDVSVVTGGSSGAYTITISISATHTDTAQWQPGRWGYDVELTYGGTVETIAEGVCTVVADYTF